MGVRPNMGVALNPGLTRESLLRKLKNTDFPKRKKKIKKTNIDSWTYTFELKGHIDFSVLLWMAPFR